MVNYQNGWIESKLNHASLHRLPTQKQPGRLCDAFSCILCLKVFRMGDDDQIKIPGDPKRIVRIGDSAWMAVLSPPGFRKWAIRF
jgi:hypothetical protein